MIPQKNKLIHLKFIFYTSQKNISQEVFRACRIWKKIPTAALQFLYCIKIFLTQLILYVSFYTGLFYILQADMSNFLLPENLPFKLSIIILKIALSADSFSFHYIIPQSHNDSCRKFCNHIVQQNYFQEKPHTNLIQA